MTGDNLLGDSNSAWQAGVLATYYSLCLMKFYHVSDLTYHMGLNKGKFLPHFALLLLNGRFQHFVHHY